MRDLLKSTGRWVRTGWIWPLALLTLPMCGLNSEGCIPDVNCEDSDSAIFEPGDDPTSAIMCDIPKFVDCADDLDVQSFPSTAGGAIALNLGTTLGDTVLDFSPDATAACANGMPKKIQFWDSFPDGTTVCINCGQIGSVYADPNKACVAKCKELNSFGGELPPDDFDELCTNARLSTNFGQNDCYAGFCSTGGTPVPTPPADPRRNPEDLVWVDFVFTTAEGNTLKFGPNEIVNGDFIAGAASQQLITTGDAWVEFSAGETGVSHVIGVRTSCDDIAACPDEDGTIGDLPLVLSLNSNGDVNVVENGNTVLSGPHLPAFAAGERFRIYVTDHRDGTADISFSRLDSTCDPDMTCVEDVFYTYTGAARPSYPLRVDATFRELNATLTNVTIMRIIK